MIETDFDAKLIDEKKEEQQKSEEGKLSLPNILLIGAQKAGTSSVGIHRKPRLITSFYFLSNDVGANISIIVSLSRVTVNADF